MPDTEASQLAFQFTLLRLTYFVCVSKYNRMATYNPLLHNSSHIMLPLYFIQQIDTVK